MNTPSIWLNSACLGPRNSRDGRADTVTGEMDLRESFSECVEWVARWCDIESERVVLTAGATDSLDIALTTRLGAPAIILHTDLAHECTRSSVVCAAEFIGGLVGREIPVAEICITDLFGLQPTEFARALAQRLADRCGSVNAVLVLEQIGRASCRERV